MVRQWTLTSPFRRFESFRRCHRCEERECNRMNKCDFCSWYDPDSIGCYRRGSKECERAAERYTRVMLAKERRNANSRTYNTTYNTRYNSKKKKGRY